MGKNGRNERDDSSCANDFFESGTYAEFLWRRLKKGGALNFIMRVYGKIRKYTLFTAVIRGIAVVIALLEKSAILLLLFSVVLLILPIALIPLTVAALISVIGYFRMNDAVKNWISQAESVTVYITSHRFFDSTQRSSVLALARKSVRNVSREESEAEFGRRPLFARCAILESEEYTHPVIVVCGDPFLVAKWAGLNLLAVKCDYFFILRRFYFTKTRVSYLLLG